MSAQLVLFYAFGAVLLGAAIGVVTVRSMVHAALLLVLAFFTAACIWVLLESEFLALTLVLVYVGAVMVLFLFVVMMLDQHPQTVRERLGRHLPVALTVAVLMALQMLLVLGLGSFAADVVVADPPRPEDFSHVAWLGRALYTDYLLPLELAAVILLVAIIAAIMLTLRRRQDSRHQDPARQVLVSKTDRLRVLKLPSEGERR